MRFLPQDIAGVFLIEIEALADDRGLFARTFCEDEFATAGCPFRPLQASTSFNESKGTLRGMHLQSGVHAETKLVRCTSGRVLDVVVDLRVDSATRCRWLAAELSSDNRRSIYIPRGCAHGFLSLEDGSEVSYLMDARFEASAQAGVRWDDVAFGIEWPFLPVSVSERDRSWPDYAR